MSITSKIVRQAYRIEYRAERLREKTGERKFQRVQRLERKARINSSIPADWNQERCAKL